MAKLEHISRKRSSPKAFPFHPVSSTTRQSTHTATTNMAAPQKDNGLKKLGPVLDASSYGYTVASNLYTTARTYVPAALEATVHKAETTLTEYSAPLVTRAQDTATAALKLADDKVIRPARGRAMNRKRVCCHSVILGWQARGVHPRRSLGASRQRSPSLPSPPLPRWTRPCPRPPPSTRPTLPTSPRRSRSRSRCAAEAVDVDAADLAGGVLRWPRPVPAVCPP